MFRDYNRRHSACHLDWDEESVRRFRQNGQFIFVGDNFLLHEEDTIKKHAVEILKYPIPSSAKISLIKTLWRNVYEAYDYKRAIELINNIIKNQ